MPSGLCLYEPFLNQAMRTCYMQACLAYVNFEGISNADIRKIFGLKEKDVERHFIND